MADNVTTIGHFPKREKNNHRENKKRYNNMKVYTIRHTKNNIVAKVENINNDLKSLQRIVGGHIEVLPISNEVPLIAIVNETGKLDNLPPTAAFIVNNNIADIIVGNIIVCRVDGENMADIIEEIDVSIIHRALAVLK